MNEHDVLTNLILNGKININDVEQNFRVRNKYVYILALRNARGIGCFEKYKNTLILMENDIESIGDEQIRYSLMRTHEIYVEVLSDVEFIKSFSELSKKDKFL